MKLENGFELIVTIVNRGWSEKVLAASKAAGAEGGTVLFGRGTGVHETQTFLGVPIEPEKDVVLTVIPEALTQTVLEAVVAAGELEKPGTGIAFVLPLKGVTGICHLYSSQGEREACRKES